MRGEGGRRGRRREAGAAAALAGPAGPAGAAGSTGTARWRAAAFSVITVVSFFTLVDLGLWLGDVETLLAERDPFRGFSRLVRVFQEDPERGIYATPPRAVQLSFNYQEFRRDKPANGFRFFVLGGSSAQGFPWGGGVAFAKVLGDSLQASFSDRTVEAVNAAAMSYASHRQRILTHELLEYEPDALVLYEGHNEFVETRFYNDLLNRDQKLDRLRSILYRWRLYSTMTRLADRIRIASGQSREKGRARTTGELLGIDVIREDGAGTREEQRRRVRDLFEENLRAILDLAGERDVPVVLCTVASNVRDWKPNQSLFDTSLPADSRRTALALLEKAKDLLQRGEAEGAASRLEEASRLAPMYAEIQFHLGRAYEALSHWDEAREAYRRARDADAQPSRVISPINDTIRRVAAERGAVLVDIERAFEMHSPHGLIGFNLIEDYVHPTPKAHRLIALELWKAFYERGLVGQARSADVSEFWKAVGEVPADDVAGIAATATPGEAAGRRANWLYNQALVLEQQGQVDQAVEKYRASLELEPRYYVAAFNLGRLLHAQRRPDLAVEQFRRALAVEPHHVKSMVGLGMALVGLERLDEAAEMLSQATEVDPDSSPAWNGLGHVLVLREDLAQAASVFRKAVELDQGNANALTNLGSVLLRLGKAGEAIPHFRASLAIQHEQRRARNGLADSLAATGELGEAEGLYRASLDEDPNDHRARSGLAALQALQARRGSRP